MEAMRDDFRRLVAKYKTPKWIASAEKDIDGSGAEALDKRDQLGTAIDKALALEAKIPLLFRRKSRIWKSIMGVCAAAVLCCMVIPYTGRVLVLLATPVPLFAVSCLIEERHFKKEAEEACREIELIRGGLKSDKPESQDEELANLRKAVSEIAESLATLVGAGPQPPQSTR